LLRRNITPLDTVLQYGDLRDFLQALDRVGQLARIDLEVSPRLEITEISRRVLARAGPALLFRRPAGSSMPVLTNLFGTPERVALAMGGTAGTGCGRSVSCSLR